MAIPRDFIRSFAFLVTALFFGTPCRSQPCELNFHVESSSIMLLEGDNVSVLCDATCFGPHADAHVTWRDVWGHQLSLRPGRLFSVRYNYGMMSRLIMLNASEETDGTYVCSYIRNGQVVQQKPLEFVILVRYNYGMMSRLIMLNASEETDGTYVCSYIRNGQVVQQKPLEFVILGLEGDYNFPRPDTGPRRGDVPPERDIERRPVRSVNRVLSQMGKEYLTLDKTAKESRVLVREQFENPRHKMPDGTAASNERVSLSRVPAISKQAYNVVSRREQGTNDMITLKISTRKDMISEHNLQKERLRMKGLRRNIVRLTAAQRHAKEKEEKSISRNINNENDREYSRYLRVKRQDPMTTEETVTQETTNDTSSTNMPDDSTNDTTPQTEPITSDLTFGNMSESTSEPETTSEAEIIHVSTTFKTDAPLDVTTTPGLMKDTTPCPEKLSNFGKHGVLAFSVSLAVAFLLLYAILMILCMPRLLARRKNKSDVEVAAYRKTGPDNSPTAPLAIFDVDEDKVQTTDAERTTAQEEKKEDGNKKDESEKKETMASVSTFLLRQDSERKPEDSATENDKLEKNDAKTPQGEEEPTPSEQTTTFITSSGSNHTDQPSTVSPQTTAPTESSSTKEQADISDLDLTEFINATLNPSTLPSSVETKSEVNNSVDKTATDPPISENGGLRSGNRDSEILPPPPPLELSDSLSV